MALNQFPGKRCTFKGQHLSELQKKNVCKLRKAIQYKNQDLVRYLIQDKTLVNDYSLDNTLHSPLHLAVISRSLEIVKILLDGGANMNINNAIGDTPLTLAAKIGNVSIIDLLLSYNVLNNSDSNSGLSHLHIACMRNESKVVRNLLLFDGVEMINNPVRKNSQSWAGYTPLHFAVHYECIETVKLLLNCKADITAKDAKQMTPLHLADYQRSEEIIDLILAVHKYVFENPMNEQKLSHFHIACTRNNPTIVEHFLKIGVDVDIEATVTCYSWRPIDFAIFYDCDKVVELLLETKTYLESDSLYGLLKYPLMIGNREIYDMISQRRLRFNKVHVKYEKLTDLHRACIQNDTEHMKKILSNESFDAKSVFNEPLWTGWTPAHLAVQSKSFGVVELLLDNRADFTLQDTESRTALHIAFDLRCVEVLDRIIKSLKSCTENLMDKFGLSIFHILCSTAEVEMITNFLSQGLDVNAQVGHGSALWAGYTPLHFAMKFLQKEVIVLLLKAGANITSKNSLNLRSIDLLFDELNTSIHFSHDEIRIAEIFTVIFSSWPEEVKKLDIQAISPLHALCMYENEDLTMLHQYLTSAPKTEINRTTELFGSYYSNKCTALHLSMQAGLWEKAKLLLENGANPLMVNSYGQTPLESITLGSISQISVADNDGIFSLEIPIEIYKSSHFHLACFLGLTNIVRLLLNKASDENLKKKFVNSINDDGATPLHSVIARVGNVSSLNEIAHLLLEHGCHVDARDFRLQTPLHYTHYEEDINVMRTLLSYGADVNAQDIYGQTPLHVILKSSYDMVCKERLVLLLESGADINILDERRRTCMVEKLEQLGNADEDENDTRECFVVLLEHVSKLRLIGFPFTESINDAYAEMIQHCGESFDVPDFISNCQKELESMMFVKIDSRTTLHDILFKSPNRMVFYCNNIVLQTLVISRELFEKFPMYGYLIALQFKIGRIRGPLLEESVKLFPLLSKISLPSICFDAISQHLSNADLKNIVLSLRSIELSLKKSRFIV
ncbi:hypothetical protein QAD02_011171 [Eretmocerus hayati]|uniref:Uncharacterized protein n=1 Tax=Eretmocerus hayati TaxID=131215 RepID=A0ACC2NVS2_9HYME|nr:hypothetical protein QAD02_011171 [Eretmocerus hayati]